jgi:hypothetical protein
MDKFQLYYYRTVSAVLPNVLLVLILWTCYDIFLSSILMMMVFYMMITLYYFQVQDRDLNVAITANIEELVYLENKRTLVFSGYFWTTLAMVPVLLAMLNFDDPPIFIPIPNNNQVVFLLVYLSFVLLLFSFGLQIVNEVFYKVFVRKIWNVYMQVALESLFEFQILFFLTQEPACLLVGLPILLVKNLSSSRRPFAESCLVKIGVSMGVVQFLALLVVVSTKYPIVVSHPKNYWKF